MTMRNCSVPSIRVRWLRSLLKSSRTRAARTRRSAFATAAMVALLSVCGTAIGFGAATEPLADLKAGSTELDAKHFSAAIATLRPLVKRLPKLADYAAWFLANAEFDSGNYAAVPKDLEPVWNQKPASPLEARAVLLAARAYGQGGEAQQALDLLRNRYATLPQPQGDLAMASAFAATGDAVSAAVYYQRVYYGFPLSTEAAQANTESERLSDQLGDNYPPAMPNMMLARALKLLESGNAERARTELESLIPRLGGAERDLARVRIGVAGYESKDALRAEEYLKALEVSSPDADSERLYYLLLCARRLNHPDEVNQRLEQLDRQYPQSKWRLEALIAVANRYLIENQLDSYEPLYRACYETFPNDPKAADCHWRVVWGHYLRRNPDAADLLRAHLRMYPASEQASGALYFLGRLSEASLDARGARTYYNEIVGEYPNYYYTVVARERLADLGPGASSPEVADFLRGVAFPARARKLNFEPDASAKARLERAHMLASAGLEDWAEGELRFGAQTEDQPHVFAMELASLSEHRASPDQAMRYIKRYASGYLYVPVESAPPDFWKLAFPIPYRADLEHYSKLNGLDPFLMAALIRQESEFNPKVVSHADARGLTQILPSTGRELSRQLKMRPYSTAKLFQPTVSLQLGTFYLKSMANTLGGRWEAALAAYNAGLRHAHAWLGWNEYREPAEFIESVPFAETRNYIQTVLRNADVYRRLYANEDRIAPRRVAGVIPPK